MALCKFNVRDCYFFILVSHLWQFLRETSAIFQLSTSEVAKKSELIAAASCYSRRLTHPTVTAGQ